MKIIKRLGCLIIAIFMSVMFVACGNNSNNNNNNENNNGGENPLVQYTVTFKVDDTIFLVKKVASGSLVEKPETDPSKENLNFVGWYDGETEWDFEENIVTKDLTLTAKFLGDYDKDNYKIIATKEQLIAYASNVENYTVNARLYSDINLGGMEWTPISSNPGMDTETEELKNVYSATFDGNGHTIKNYKISSNVQEGLGTPYVGFFGLIDYATICNLNLSDFIIDIVDYEAKTGIMVGGLVGGITQANVVNCSVKGSINLEVSNNCTELDGFCVGGLVGMTIYGLAESSTVSNCYSMVNINFQGISGSSFNCFGGLIGMYSSKGSIVSNCYSTGNINMNLIENEGAESCVGGFIGLANDFIEILNSYATGNINVMYSGDDNVAVGGFVSISRAVIENCYRYNGQIISAPSGSEICEEGISADMQTIWKFVSENWDSDIWNLYTDKNPTLKAFS